MKRPMNYSKYWGNPFVGHSVSVALIPSNWIFGVAFMPRCIVLHMGPFNIAWHRPKLDTDRANSWLATRAEMD